MRIFIGMSVRLKERSRLTLYFQTSNVCVFRTKFRIINITHKTRNALAAVCNIFRYLLSDLQAKREYVDMNVNLAIYLCML